MKCSNFPKETRILIILLIVIWLGGFAVKLNEIFTVNGGWQHWVTALAFLISAILCMTAYGIGLKDCVIIDENGVTFSRPFEKNRFYMWEEVRFVAEYDVPYRTPRSNGIIFSFEVEEYNIKTKIKSQDLVVIGKKSSGYRTVFCSEEMKKSLKKYVPYSKRIRKKLKYEDFG